MKFILISFRKNYICVLNFFSFFSCFCCFMFFRFLLLFVFCFNFSCVVYFIVLLSAGCLVFELFVCYVVSAELTVCDGSRFFSILFYLKYQSVYMECYSLPFTLYLTVLISFLLFSLVWLGFFLFLEILRVELN